MVVVEKLTGKKVAILAADGFEVSELFEPKNALLQAGAKVFIVSLSSGSIRGWEKKDWANKEISVDLTVNDTSAKDFDALVLPGGVINPDLLRQNEKAVQFIRDMVEAGKPIAAICHGPWMLAEAGVLEGRTVTSYGSIRTDMINAGAAWVDQSVVVDRGFITSRSPEDLSDFNKKMVEEFAQGPHDPFRRAYEDMPEAQRYQ